MVRSPLFVLGLVLLVLPWIVTGTITLTSPVAIGGLLAMGCGWYLSKRAAVRHQRPTRK
jgi:hypothetical protein